MLNYKIKIGLTLDYIEPEKDKGGEWYSNYPWYGMRSKYIKTIGEIGAVPFPIPYVYECVEDYVKTIDALIITGGGFDIDPKLYGENNYLNPKTRPKLVRNKFELFLLENFIKTGKPVLGICGGMQLINVFYGGTLYQDILDENPVAFNHLQKNPDQPHHTVEIYENTMLYKIAGGKFFNTNTSHHQSIKNLGSGLIVSAQTSDGIIEGIENPNHNFCIGLQWHPEWLVSEADKKIFKNFIETAFAIKFH